MAELSKGLENRPYMVIDDGWEPKSIQGPWDKGNERFPDMKRLASEIAAMDVIPGIWIRFLYDETQPEEWFIKGKWGSLDPSIPEVLRHVAEDTKRLVDWGYKLIKHDYSTYDLLGFWGINMPYSMAADGWSFKDNTRTSAEIILEFYRVILENSGDALILGCNCIGHLCAGLVHLNRTGDDTSGREWERTRKMGINTLAFRLYQNNKFFAADADCVGATNEVPWQLNRRWLDILSKSASPLFVSSKKGVVKPENINELKEAFRRASLQKDVLKPVDWTYTTCPQKWSLNGEEIEYCWYEI
jgi:alpha-galactosidase